MIFDWDLWPSIVAYESDWGRIERMRRASEALGKAVARLGMSVEQANRGLLAFGEALRAAMLHHPAGTARK